MKSLVIGAGQIGKALQEIFSRVHECSIRDIEGEACHGIEVLHIAYPYTEDFIDVTQAYIDEYNPILTIIHSSVAIGTTERMRSGVVHSPERGRYPNLADEMVKFVKYVAGGTNKDRLLAKCYFDALNWPTVLIEDSRWTEFLKIQSNAHMGLEIAWRQELDRMTERLFGEPCGSLYNAWEESYARGNMKLGHTQLIRSIMRSDPIGGHCILPCVDMLAGHYESPFLNLIRESNAKRQKETSSYRSARAVSR